MSHVKTAIIVGCPIDIFVGPRLSKMGIRFETFDSETTAIDYLSHSLTDLVIVNGLALRDTNTFEFLAAIKKAMPRRNLARCISITAQLETGMGRIGIQK